MKNTPRTLGVKRNGKFLKFLPKKYIWCPLESLQVNQKSQCQPTKGSL
jgi:hypothetical protein